VNRCVLGHGNVIVGDSLKSVFWGQGDQVNRCVLGHGNVIVYDILKKDANQYNSSQTCPFTQRTVANPIVVQQNLNS
jgi:hypothetical protein